MAAQSTYTPIGTQTASGSVQSLSFTSIPQTYTDIVIAVQLRSSTAATVDSWQVQVNGTSSIYSDTWLRSDGATTTSIRNTSTYGCVAGNCPAASATTGIFNSGVVHLQNYANTAINKTLISKSASDASGSGHVIETVGLIRTTSAITRIDVFTSSANMVAGSTVTLYGITAA